jgi:hypothetical protein
LLRDLLRRGSGEGVVQRGTNSATGLGLETTKAASASVH